MPIFIMQDITMDKELPIETTQFHPESIASEFGHELLKNFLRL